MDEDEVSSLLNIIEKASQHTALNYIISAAQARLKEINEELREAANPPPPVPAITNRVDEENPLKRRT